MKQHVLLLASFISFNRPHYTFCLYVLLSVCCVRALTQKQKPKENTTKTDVNMLHGRIASVPNFSLKLTILKVTVMVA